MRNPFRGNLSALARLLQWTFTLLLAACAVSPSPEVLTVTPSLPTATSLPTSHEGMLLPSPTTRALPSPTESPLPASPTATPKPGLCSPLQGIPLAELPDMVFNPFHPPRPGSDDPHQGVDLADLDPASRIALKGRPVQSVLDGRVASVLLNRFPYGNAVLIETPLDRLPPDWIAQLQLPTPAPTLEPKSALTCPQVEAKTWDLENRSLYLLYAHMEQPPSLHPSDPVSCGQAIGAIGSSGNALNPHLHLEIRLGPSGVRFSSLAHYTTSATPEEMANYCTWRVSGLFQLIDPLRVIDLRP